MGIKIGQAEFSKHEFALLVICLAFFALLFFGSFAFKTTGKFFPMLVGGPGFIMVSLYLLSGLISPRLYETMKKGTDFKLFGLIPDEGTLPSEQEPEEDKPVDQVPLFKIHFSYLVLSLFFGFVLFSYLFGFYVSTVAFSASYLFLVEGAGENKEISMISKIALILLLVGVVYGFDYSFGHNFMEGAVYQLFGQD